MVHVRRGKIYRSIPRDATFPANRAPALPRLESFSFSFSLLSEELVGCDEDEEITSLPEARIVGKDPRLSVTVTFPGIGPGVGGVKADVREVRWLR